MKKRSILAVVGVAALTISAWIPTAAVASTEDPTSPTPASETSGDDAYDLVVNGQSTTLDEGEVATFPLQAIQPAGSPGTVSPRVVYPGNGGTITVTASKGVYSWKVNAPCAYSFVGSFSITDLSSGLGGGFTPATTFSGSAPTSKLWNHRYSGTLTGTASNFWGPCAWTGPNATLYTYQGG